MADLPPFPVDEGTLSLLEAAMDPWTHVIAALIGEVRRLRGSS